MDWFGVRRVGLQSTLSLLIVLRMPITGEQFHRWDGDGAIQQTSTCPNNAGLPPSSQQR
ncbi:hypothetical protein [Nitrosomonas sp.]|uniref:hypothetical protein n=1 Tax=Nitrosomonas sp. TaxID=42353 RepID=UPI00273278F7|nr:hypothetical protein [Nitrosomonas sp.]